MLLNHILLDISYILSRNTLGDWKVFHNEKQPIKWSLFENLVGLLDEIEPS